MHSVVNCVKTKAMVDDKVNAILLPYLEKALSELNKKRIEIEDIMKSMVVSDWSTSDFSTTNYEQEKYKELSEQADLHRKAIKKLCQLLNLVKGTKN